MPTKYLKSLKAELSRHVRYAITCKDTDGHLWYVGTPGWWAKEPVFYLLHKEEGEEVQFDNVLLDKKGRDQAVKLLKSTSPNFWTRALYDYIDGEKPTTLIKKSVRTLCVMYSYDESKIEGL